MDPGAPPPGTGYDVTAEQPIARGQNGCTGVSFERVSVTTRYSRYTRLTASVWLISIAVTRHRSVGRTR